MTGLVDRTMTTRRRSRGAFPRFLDLSWSDVNCDLHVHTNRTDGQDSIRSLLSCAMARGLGRIAFTEHVRQDTEWFDEFAAEVEGQRLEFSQLEVLVGCEAKALDILGTLDVSAEILQRCDLVLGSVHRFPDGRGGYVDFRTLSPEAFAQIELDLATGLVNAAPIDVLAHPGGMYFRRFGDFPSDMMRTILQACRDQGVAVEISSSYLRDFGGFLALCREINPRVSIGSDVHRLQDLGRCRDQLREHGVGLP